MRPGRPAAGLPCDDACWRLWIGVVVWISVAHRATFDHTGRIARRSGGRSYGRCFRRPNFSRAHPSHAPTRRHFDDAVLDRNARLLPDPRYAEASTHDFDLNRPRLNHERCAGRARSYFAHDSTAIEHDEHAVLRWAPEHDCGLGLDVQRQTLKRKV